MEGGLELKLEIENAGQEEMVIGWWIEEVGIEMAG